MRVQCIIPYQHFPVTTWQFSALLWLPSASLGELEMDKKRQLANARE